MGGVVVLAACAALAPAAGADSLLYKNGASGTWFIANSDGTNAHPVESPNPQFTAGALGDDGTVHLLDADKIDNDAPGGTIQSTPIVGLGQRFPFGQCNALADPVINQLIVAPDGRSFISRESQLDSCQGDLQTSRQDFIGTPAGAMFALNSAGYFLDGTHVVVEDSNGGFGTADPVGLAQGTSTSVADLTPLASIGLSEQNPPVYSRDGTKALVSESNNSLTEWELFVFLLLPDGSQDTCAASPVVAGTGAGGTTDPFLIGGIGALPADWSSDGSFVDVQESDGIHQLTPISASACAATTTTSDTSAVIDKLVVPGGMQPSLGAGGNPAGFPVSEPPPVPPPVPQPAPAPAPAPTPQPPSKPQVVDQISSAKLMHLKIKPGKTLTLDLKLKKAIGLKVTLLRKSGKKYKRIGSVSVAKKELSVKKTNTIAIRTFGHHRFTKGSWEATVTGSGETHTLKFKVI